MTGSGQSAIQTRALRKVYPAPTSKRGARPPGPPAPGAAPSGTVIPRGEVVALKGLDPVHVVPGSRLGRILGVEETLVNSMHHQGIKQLAPGLVPSAVAPDGLIEGIEGSNGQFLVGVQWHPEELAAQPGPMRDLFDAFAGAAAAFREGRGA